MKATIVSMAKRHERVSWLVLTIVGIIMVFAPTTDSQLVLDTFVYQRVVEAVHTIFNNTCVIFMYNIENPMQALDLYDAEQLMSLPAYIGRLHVRTFAYSVKSFKESVGDNYFTLKRPLFILINDSEEMKRQFSQIIAPWIAMAYINWMIFFREDTNIANFFSEIHVPLDCIFLVVQKLKNNDSYILTEVYSIAKGRELITDIYGTWSEQEGLSITKWALYQRRSNLQGQLIRVASVQDPPISLIERDGLGKMTGIKGFFGTVVQILQENLNCTCRTFIKRPYYAAVKWTAYSDPFYGGIWISLLAIMVISSVFILIGYKISPACRMCKKEEVCSSFYGTFFYTFGAICSQGHDSIAIDSIRMIDTVIYMTGVIILAAYSAALISFLAVKVFIMPFTTMAGLLEDGSYKLGVIAHSADYGFFQKTTDKILQRMFDEIMDDVEKLPINYLEGLNYVCSEDKYAFMTTDNMFAILEHQVPCILEPLDTIMQTTAAMAVPKRSPFRGIINSNILLMRDSGVLQRVIATELAIQSAKMNDHWISVEIVDILPLMLLIIGGSFVSLVLLILEKVQYSKFRNSFKISFKRKLIKQKFFVR